MKNLRKLFCCFLLCFSFIFSATSQHSVARQWNEVLLEAIRNDFARPTVHSRNLFHVSAAMYDAWAVYDEVAETYMLGKVVDGYGGCSFDGITLPDQIQAAREEAISFAAYRLLQHRFQYSPGSSIALSLFDSLLTVLNYDKGDISTNYQSGSPTALGNYIAQCYIDFGLQDFSNEQNGYANLYYKQVNNSIMPNVPGVSLNDFNRWQAIALDVFVDQSGQVLGDGAQPFLSPEWGLVSPFALEKEDLNIYYRDGDEYWVYHDPGPPPFTNLEGEGPAVKLYQQGFALVSAWSSHLDPSDNVLWDISPASIGNIEYLPESFSEYEDFYNLMDGGDPSQGHPINPHTGQPYEPQLVPRGDYTRVLAEFWADGPDSETPPGHWYTILNYVSDHPELEKRFKGEGVLLDDLEWDIKSYFILGGGVHDSAISAWGIKGWYDYLRPISAIRWMAGLGQSSDPSLENYHPAGLPLIPGYIEVIEPGDSLAGTSNQFAGEIKLYAWRGPRYITNPAFNRAGVGWIRADDWWPYQRPSFVTPPFAGYISGHSTFSRAAAEIMTLLTGDPFFPGGLGEFVAPKDSFLVFEKGPSVDVVLQWATYQDASDQTSLSRIWGGIHPPADDIPGRLIGLEIGKDAFAHAEKYFQGQAPEAPVYVNDGSPKVKLYPNPTNVNDELTITFDRPVAGVSLGLYNAQGQLHRALPAKSTKPRLTYSLDVSGLNFGIYILHLTGEDWKTTHKVCID